MSDKYLGGSHAESVNGTGVLLRSFFVDHDPVDLDCSHDGLTRQEFAAECDINSILASYEKNRVFTHINPAAPQYLDVSAVPNLQEALHIVEAANEAFMTLHAKVRAQFENDPVAFVDFASDPANLDQLREWGLAPPAKPADASPAPGASPAAPAAPVPQAPAAAPASP